MKKSWSRGTTFNPAVDGYFNPYGDPAAHSPALLAFIGSGYLRSENISTVGSFNLKADGVLFALPGGDLRMAVGVDYRQERFETSGENFISGAALRIAAPTAFERDVSAAFVELRAPLVGPDNARPGLERLELSLAGRVEDHEGIGQTSNPTDPIAVLDELQRMAVMLFPVHDRADPFWAEAARTGFIGVGGYVAATPERPFTLKEPMVAMEVSPC